ncbi:hypothetical protein [Streptomyces sp. NPDC086182]|uniref:hypothetical protein n=1 Tax=Streptomyces sp. NPDC086182 TaxID=3155058 RepID=UPI0034397FC5
MTVRTLRWLAYWTATLTTAAIASLAAALPFTGTAASATGVLAAAAVCLIGTACAPTTPTRKDVRP